MGRLPGRQRRICKARRRVRVATDRPRHWFRVVRHRILLPIAVILCFGGMAIAQDLPRPPCVASPPDPNYAAAGAPPNIRVWDRRDQAAPWVPPSCTGWTAKGAGVLVAVAGSFSGGGSEDLLKRFGAISALEGVRYWSVTEGGWRTLITHATALEGPDLGRNRSTYPAPSARGRARIASRPVRRVE